MLFHIFFLDVASDENRFGHNDSPRRIDPCTPASDGESEWDGNDIDEGEEREGEEGKGEEGGEERR